MDKQKIKDLEFLLQILNRQKLHFVEREKIEALDRLIESTKEEIELYKSLPF